jgi:hypothetical protein
MCHWPSISMCNTSKYLLGGGGPRGAKTLQADETSQDCTLGWTLTKTGFNMTEVGVTFVQPTWEPHRGKKQAGWGVVCSHKEWADSPMAHSFPLSISLQTKAVPQEVKFAGWAKDNNQQGVIPAPVAVGSRQMQITGCLHGKCLQAANPR